MKLLAAAFIAAAMGWSCASQWVRDSHGAPTPLFDGHSLAGWTQRGGKAVYRVEDGCIVGTSRPNTGNSFLCTEAVYRDFILELDFQVDPALNSGIQIRSQTKPDYKNGAVYGYQIEIDPSPRQWTGGIYDESRRGWLVNLDQNPAAKAAFKPGAWNHLRIVAKGDRIQTWLNGIAAADLHDSTTLQGFIGLQVHDVGNRKDELKIRWRDIVLTHLD